jgi:hypothetical protein
VFLQTFVIVNELFFLFISFADDTMKNNHIKELERIAKKELIVSSILHAEMSTKSGSKAWNVTNGRFKNNF